MKEFTATASQACRRYMFDMGNEGSVGTSRL